MYAMLAAIAGARAYGSIVGFPTQSIQLANRVSIALALHHSWLGLAINTHLGIYTHVAYALVMLGDAGALALAVIWLGASWR